MTKPGLSLLAVLLDRSSSTRPVAGAIRSGVDALLADQREHPGELLVTVASCSGAGQETACAPRPVAEVGPVALRPRGGSALREGIVTLIEDLGTELAGMAESERPERVVLAVVGDTAADAGDGERVRELVERQRRDYAWEFVLVDVSCVPRVSAGDAAAAGACDGGGSRDETCDRVSGNRVSGDGGSRDETRDRVSGDGGSHDEPCDRVAGNRVSSDGVPADGASGDAAGERSDVLTAVALTEARLGVPATAAVLAGPGPDGVRAGLAAASAFVTRARESRPWEPVEGFTDAERAAASVPAAARPSWWRRLTGSTG